MSHKRKSPPRGQRGGPDFRTERGKALKQQYSRMSAHGLRSVAAIEMREGVFTRELSLLIDRLDNPEADHG